MKNILILCNVLLFSMVGSSAIAGNDASTNGIMDNCTVSFNEFTIDEEFGDGINDITRCLKNQQQIKLVMQVNKSCRDTTVVLDNDAGGYKLENHPKSCGENRGYGIAQMINMIRDYEVTHGISLDQLDLKIIVHGGGGLMLLDTYKVPWDNNLQSAVEDLMDKGVRFYFCQNTVRGLAKKMKLSVPEFVDKVILDVEYVTGGLTALADFQKEGYVYIQP
ncbi:MAG: DsrE family protein [Proteobacteria bacterium]|nr:DsrE family protein [Pseudomonadota bacterium]